MMDTTRWMQTITAGSAVAILAMVIYLAWGGTRQQDTRVEEAERTEVTEEDTAGGLGVTQSIERATPPAPPAPTVTTDPEPETVTETSPPTQTSSPRAELYQQAELEALRRELEADLQDTMERRELRKLALRAPIGTSRFSFGGAQPQTGQTGQAGGQAGGMGRSEQAEPADRSAASALPTLAPSLVLGAPAAALGGGEDGMGQGKQGANASEGPGALTSADIGYSPHRTVAPRSPFELRKGTVIPGLLATAINSDIPGFVSGTVRLDVFDTVTGHHLLVPAGSRVFGRYDPDTAYGQNRLDVSWTHLMFPDGDAIVLQGQQATDGAGQSGFRDRRKGNFLRTLGGNLLFSIIDTSEQAAQAYVTEAITGAAPDDSALADALESLGSGLSGGGGGSSAAALFNRQQSQLKPTLIIRPGYPFNILVARDLILEPRR